MPFVLSRSWIAAALPVNDHSRVPPRDARDVEPDAARGIATDGRLPGTQDDPLVIDQQPERCDRARGRLSLQILGFPAEGVAAAMRRTNVPRVFRGILQPLADLGHDHRQTRVADVGAEPDTRHDRLFLDDVGSMLQEQGEHGEGFRGERDFAAFGQHLLPPSVQREGTKPDFHRASVRQIGESFGFPDDFPCPIRQSDPVITGPQPPTGDRIASEVEREMEERLYRLRHVVLAPAEYHIYLHPDDFKHIEDVAPRIALDVQLCLNSLVERLNKRSRAVGARRAPARADRDTGRRLGDLPQARAQQRSRPWRARHPLTTLGAERRTFRERRGHDTHRADGRLRHRPPEHGEERSGRRPEGRDRRTRRKPRARAWTAARDPVAVPSGQRRGPGHA